MHLCVVVGLSVGNMFYVFHSHGIVILQPGNCEIRRRITRTERILGSDVSLGPAPKRQKEIGIYASFRIKIVGQNCKNQRVHIFPAGRAVSQKRGRLLTRVRLGVGGQR